MRYSFRNNFFQYLLFGLLLISIQSCNLFRYGIEERNKEGKTGNSSKINNERTKTASLILKSAKQFDGTPYKLGGDSKNGIDCSALTMLSYKNAGIVLPRTSFEQSKIGETIKLEDAQPGDLIFFKFKKSKSNNPVNHVGIVSKVEKNGIVYFYHASTSLGVTESSLAESYYKEVFVKITRVY
jgi:cell wall-associated NlpC family hydrolase